MDNETRRAFMAPPPEDRNIYSASKIWAAAKPYLILQDILSVVNSLNGDMMISMGGKSGPNSFPKKSRDKNALLFNMLQ
jgi:hypothetical protein